MRNLWLMFPLLLGCTRIDQPTPGPVDPAPAPATSREAKLAATASRTSLLALADAYDALADIQDSAKPMTPKQVNEWLAAAGSTTRAAGWKPVADDDAATFQGKPYDPKLDAQRLRKFATGIRSAVK